MPVIVPIDDIQQLWGAGCSVCHIVERHESVWLCWTLILNLLSFKIFALNQQLARSRELESMHGMAVRLY